MRANIADLAELSDDQKQRLHTYLERARDIRKLAVVPFSAGHAQLPATTKTSLRALLDQPRAMRYRGDPTVIFVVLGYPDLSLDERLVPTIAVQRARSLKTFMEKEAHVVNVTHALIWSSRITGDEPGDSTSCRADIWAIVP
jgi:hypothetical protein